MATLLLSVALVAAHKGAPAPLTCQPLALQPKIPTFHIIGNVSRNATGGLEFESINDANGFWHWKGVWHVFHQCCQNHWDHVVSTDLVHWKRLPSPVRPDKNPQHWYDAKGSFDGSAAILPGKGPVILVDNIGPFTPPPLGSRSGDNPGCQGLSWPDDLSDPELKHWTKDPLNPLSITNLACGSRTKNTAGAFPGSIWRNGDHWNYLSFGFRFTSNDSELHTWRMAEPQFLSNRSAHENGGQWFFNLPLQAASSEPQKELGPSQPTHMVSCGGGNRWCLGFYDSANESWQDFTGSPAGPPTPGSLAALCPKWGDNGDVPGGDYNRGAASRNDFKGCVKNGDCPCQADCLADPKCDAWTVVPSGPPRCAA
jgi:hypothetical protein